MRPRCPLADVVGGSGAPSEFCSPRFPHSSAVSGRQQSDGMGQPRVCAARARFKHYDLSSRQLVHPPDALMTRPDNPQ